MTLLGRTAAMSPDEVRALRLDLGWTQEMAAMACEVSLRTWTRWESGESTISPAVALLIRERLR